MRSAASSGGEPGVSHGAVSHGGGASHGSNRRKKAPRRAALDAESLPSDLAPPARPASAPPPHVPTGLSADRRPPPPRRSDGGDVPAGATRVSARVLAAAAGCDGAALPPRPSRSAGGRSLFAASEYGLASGAATASGGGKLRTRPTNNQLL
jgi:hypothetical protein